MSKNYFADNLRHLRAKRGMEQLELAQLLGRKSASSISEWERGTYTPKVGVLSDIARIFNVSLTDLMDKDLTESKVNYKKPNSNSKDFKTSSCWLSRLVVQPSTNSFSFTSA